MPQNIDSHQAMAQDVLTDGPIQNIAYYLNSINAPGLIKSGLAAARPATGTTGAFYYATDTGALSFWNGSAWVAVGGGGGGGGGSTIKAVDLGVIDIPTVILSGPQTLYAMQPGEMLARIRFTDTDLVPWDFFTGASQTYAWLGIGTVKSFGWAAFAMLGASAGLANDQFSMFDTEGEISASAAVSLAYSAYQAQQGAGQARIGRSMVLSVAPGSGDVIAALFSPTSDDTGLYFAALAAWVMGTDYTAVGLGPSAVPVQALVTAAGHVWINAAAAGTSGGTSPDFAGNIGGSVVDGADIVWWDQGAIPTVGAVHAVAEIWTPA